MKTWICCVLCFCSALPAWGAIAAPDRAKVIVEELKESPDVKHLLVPVKVEAKLRSVVTAEIEGWVTKIKKPLGSTVKRGEVILYVENKDPTFTYAAVPVRAPIAGVVSEMEPSLMSKVARGDTLFAVMDPKALKLAAEIPGDDLPFLKPGSPGIFKAELSDDGGLPIKLTGVSPVVDPRTGTAPAELEFVPAKTGKKGKSKGKEQAAAMSPEASPAIGSVGHALFELSRRNVILVPETAIAYTDGKPMVDLLGDKGTVVRKPVVLGEQQEDMLVVKSGLEEGEKVILRSSRPVKEGDAVEVESAGK